MDIAKALMIIDECHYNLVKNIKEYDYNNPLDPLKNQLKTTIDDYVYKIDGSYYNNIQRPLSYILTSFSDNLFLLHGPQQYYQQWSQYTMEKIYFNTVTSGYIFRQNLKSSMEKNESIPIFLLYAYWLFFFSLGTSNGDDINFKNFFKSMGVNAPLKISSPSHDYNNQWIKTNAFHLLIFLVVILMVIFGNKYIYLLWINDKIIASI